MIHTVTTISALLLAIGGLNMGAGLQGSLLGLRAGLEDFSVLATGLIMASYYFGFIVGSIRSPKLVNTVGHIRTFAALASIFSSAALIHALWVTPVTWALLRGISGFCLAGSVMVAESWLNQASSNANRGAVLSIYMIVSLGATGVGQLFLNMFPPSGVELFVVVSVLISLALVPVALTTNPAPPIQETPSMSVRRLLAMTPLGVVGCFATGLLTGCMWALGAVFALGIGLSTAKISLFMFLFVTGGMIAQWPLGRLSDHVDRRKVIAGLYLSTLVVGVAFVVVARMGGGEMANLGLGVLLGVFLLPTYGVVVAHANDHVESHEFVPAASTLLICYGVGATAGPALASVFMQWIGPSGLFVFVALVALLAGGFATYRMIKLTPIPEADRTDFVHIPRTTAAALELDPRAEEPEEEPAPADETAPETVISDDGVVEDVAEDDGPSPAAPSRPKDD